jgi:hypothetical protein
MKKDNFNENSFLTRAELINRSRLRSEDDKLPKQCKGMFDNLSDFKQGTRAFIDLAQPKKKP